MIVNDEPHPQQKCVMKNCDNQGVPLDGHAIYLCPACADQMERIVRREYAKRINKLFARHVNN